MEAVADGLGDIAKEAPLTDLHMGLHRHTRGKKHVRQTGQLFLIDQDIGPAVLLTVLVVGGHVRRDPGHLAV